MVECADGSVCMVVYGGQRTTLDIVCQAPPTLFFDTRPQVTSNSSETLDLAGQQAPENLFSFPELGFCAHSTMPTLLMFFLPVSVGWVQVLRVPRQAFTKWAIVSWAAHELFVTATMNVQDSSTSHGHFEIERTQSESLGCVCKAGFLVKLREALWVLKKMLLSFLALSNTVVDVIWIN